MEVEIWKDIEGYEGIYKVSNKGNVKSLERKVKKFDGYRTIKEKILKPEKCNNGYFRIRLNKEGKEEKYLLHRLVACAFVQNDSLFNNEINHIDENKANNCASNLEWCDRTYNINYGTRNIRVAKAQSKPVICIETGKIYTSTNEVQRQLGFSQGHICDCCNKRYGRKTVCGYHWEWAE